MRKAIGRYRVTPVILSGGSGTRLWPLSRAATPKQMLALTGSRTMLQMTAERVAEQALFDPATVVVGEAQADQVAEQLMSGGLALGRIILEPCPRNTAPAIAAAAMAAGEDELLLVMPSDHLIRDQQSFIAAVEAAAPAAREGRLVTFGVRPDRPETGYGYIKRGAEIAPGTFLVERFVEKPDAQTASAYVESGLYEWNAGIFLFSAGAYLSALSLYAQDIHAAVAQSMEGAARSGARLRPDTASFAQARSQSIDHAVMEHAENIAVFPVDMGWSDLGSWQALYEVSDKDGDGNAVSGEAVTIDASNCLIRSGDRLVVSVGVEDLAIIATGDVILVIPRKDSQRVREAAEILAARGDKRV